MVKKHNGPKFKSEPSVGKNPRNSVNPDNNLSKKPSWRVSKLEMEGSYGWHTVDLQTFQYIQSKLAAFESMTWDQIFVQAKKSNHSCSVDKLSKDAQRRLLELNMDDLDELHSLRLDGQGRVWGVFTDGCFSLLWWDPLHQVYPSQKKHT